jgi:hypothetical protein
MTCKDCSVNRKVCNRHKNTTEKIDKNGFEYWFRMMKLLLSQAGEIVPCDKCGSPTELGYDCIFCKR